ncbi:complement component C8 gamma chain isoform X1 [Hemicordylus capensis]|uniref:complement component C8 gamma chain isoform X1 n=1 Tax=Hemicordylus capensis TaxID=884348 RepID=UPI002304B615|nr:complement component C8 gamma chain isoform X1 [Hemicordylus capensis]
MGPATFLFLSALLLASPSCAQRRWMRPPAENPIDKISIQANFDPNQFAGKWFLVGVASRCSYLSENSHQLEATNVVVSVAGTTPSKSLLIGTSRPMDGICWNIKQFYHATKTPGRYLLKGRGSPVDVVVGETDYSSYAIVYYQKARKITAKLYGRNIRVSDAMVTKFEERVVAVGFNEDLTYYFPTYGFCDVADQFHILDGLIS